MAVRAVVNIIYYSEKENHRSVSHITHSGATPTSTSYCFTAMPKDDFC